MVSGKAVIAVVVVFVVLLFVPFVPVTHSSSWVLGSGNTQMTADVSPTYLLLHCGAVANIRVTDTFLGYTYPAGTNQAYNFICNFQITSSS